MDRSMPDRIVDTLVLPGTSQGVAQAIEAMGRFGIAHALPERVRQDLQVALDEILSNVVRHGLRGREGVFCVSYAVADDAVSVEVVDDAPAFDPLSLPAPDTDAPLDARVPGGLGVALVSALMDDVRYERREGRNHLVMTRRITR
jgi:serine/threonine-protein kinase RsbW